MPVTAGQRPPHSKLVPEFETVVSDVAVTVELPMPTSMAGELTLAIEGRQLVLEHGRLALAWLGPWQQG